jgi:hypothetical protein
MPSSFNGICHPDTYSAADAFLQQFPRIDTSTGAPVVFEITGSTITGAGVFYQLQSRNLQTGTIALLPPDSIIFPSCTPETLNAYPVQDMVFYLALVVLWAFGFQSGQHR